MKGLITAIVLAAAAAIAYAGYKSLNKTQGAATAGAEAKPAAAAQPGGAAPPPEVGYLVAAPADLPITYDFVGTAAPSRKVEVRARIQGFLNSRSFEEGSLVHEGDLLYEIDPRAYEADLDIQKAQAEQARAQLELAKRETERLDTLLKSHIISQSEFDKQKATLDEAEAAVNLAQANLEKAKLELSYTRVKAPLTGLIQETHKDSGSLVDDSNNSLLTEVMQVDPMYVNFQMSEGEFAKIQEGLKQGSLITAGKSEPHIELTLVGGEAYPQRGEINFQDPVIDPQTGTVRYRAEVPNADGKLKPGQFVQAHLKGLIRPNSIAVPQATVSQSPAGAFVDVIGKDDMIESRKVDLSAWSGSDWIVNSGLTAGEKIVASGTSKLQPGMKVVAKPEADLAPAEKPADGGAPGAKNGAGQ